MCGGNVVVDGATGTGDSTATAGTTTTGYGGYPVTTTTGYGGDVYPPSTSAGYGGYGGGGVPVDAPTGCTPDCGQWLVNGATGICPGGPALAQMDLIACACAGSACQTSCGYNVCMYGAASDPCLQCMQSACPTQLTSCQES